MLATLTEERFSRAGWLFERKLDGERCLAFRHGGSLRLFSRNQLALEGTYPEIAEALRRERCGSFIADGEIVAFEGSRTSFAQLQKRMQIRDPREALRAGVPVFYYIFDLLWLEGRDLRRLPLHDRKNLLSRTLELKDPLRSVELRETEGEAFLSEACRSGWEGLIAKNSVSTYQSGRSRDWLKFKCTNQQEFVIGGYTDPQGSRIGFGALLVGYWEREGLVYAGKVGTGYNERLLRELSSRLRAREARGSPFRAAADLLRGAHWVKPELVCEVRFTEWTGDGRLRHPRFLGLRDDKPAREVVREG